MDEGRLVFSLQYWFLLMNMHCFSFKSEIKVKQSKYNFFLNITTLLKI